MSFPTDDELINETDWPQTIRPRRGIPFASWVLGFLAGAATTFFLDPDQGRRRRVMFMDQFGRRARKLSDWSAKKQRHLGHIIEGLPHRIGHVFGASAVDDEILVERIRAQMGRTTRHPGSIRVDAAAGRVSLSGPILASEVERLMKSVRRVPGVRHVINNMRIYSRGANIPSLQGAGKSYLNV